MPPAIVALRICRPIKSISISIVFVITAVSLGGAIGIHTVAAQASEDDTFHPNDIRVFKAVACTKDFRAVEALYYIAASRADMATGKPSPTSQLMKEEIDQNWAQIASRLTKDEVIEERFANIYNAVLAETIPLLEQGVTEKSGVSIFVSEVNSRLMDATKDKDIPACQAK
jgi:hypothetical protein